MIDGIVSKLPGELYIAVDLAGEADTCVEWKLDEYGNIHVLDIYESRKEQHTDER